MITLGRVVGATISAVKIRAVTLGLDFSMPEVQAEPFEAAARFLKNARQAFAEAGIEVQTTRVAGPDLGPTLGRVGGGQQLARWAIETERVAGEAGVDYVSLGRFPVNAHAVVAQYVAEVLSAGEIGFFSAELTDGRLPSIDMARACARAVKDLARTTPLGFGNLRFAATANCPPNIPFLPAAYHGGGAPRFSIAVQAADVVVDATSGRGSISEIEDRLVHGLEAATAPVEQTALRLAAEHGFPFVGVDLSPAPFPSDDTSIGHAMEQAGVERFGAPGTLHVAAMITRALRRTKVQRCGFSGLMLPLLEDSVLARRAAEHPPTLHGLLLYSAVCGTGLDTIPLPEHVSEAELAGIYLDVATLSIALNNKPLTARLLPVPGARAGDLTAYTFDYFANTRVLPDAGAGTPEMLVR